MAVVVRRHVRFCHCLFVMTTAAQICTNTFNVIPVAVCDDSCCLNQPGKKLIVVTHVLTVCKDNCC